VIAICRKSSNRRGDADANTSGACRGRDPGAGAEPVLLTCIET
jgi:hypothetical protein